MDDWLLLVSSERVEMPAVCQKEVDRMDLSLSR